MGTDDRIGKFSIDLQFRVPENYEPFYHESMIVHEVSKRLGITVADAVSVAILWPHSMKEISRILLWLWLLVGTKCRSAIKITIFQMYIFIVHSP